MAGVRTAAAVKKKMPFVKTQRVIKYAQRTFAGNEINRRDDASAPQNVRQRTRNAAPEKSAF